MSTLAISLKQISTTWVLSLMGVVLLMVFLLALTIGSVPVSVSEIISIVGTKLGWVSSVEMDSVKEAVLLNIRLPRLVMTLLIGGSLGVCGAALQGLFRNPLIEPGLIGVSSGSAFTVVLLIVFGAALSIDRSNSILQLLMPVAAFAGGLLATILVVKMSYQVGKTNVAVLILSGVAVNALAGGLIGLTLFYADENQLRSYTFWTLGDLGGASWSKLLVAAPLLIIACTALLSFHNAINAIALGESEAYHMGVDVERVKRYIIFFSALAVGVSVSLAGIIGFIGLVVPHLIRILFNADNRLVLPASVLGGAILLILADLMARTVVFPAELPIGVVTALIGAPFFIGLLMRSKLKSEV